MFVGRLAEVTALESALVQTRAGNPSNVMITGERGIGKSSLLNYFKDVAQGELVGLDETEYRFLVVDTDVDENTTQLGLVKKLQLGLDRVLGKTESGRTFLKTSWEFLRHIEAGPVKIRDTQVRDDSELLLDQFSYSLAELVERVCSDGDTSIFGARFEGILVAIDEADKSGPALSLGSFVKLLAERLQRRGCRRVAFCLAGLPELRAVLSDSHKSSLRLFEELMLERLSADDVATVIEIGLQKTNAGNSQPMSITSEASKFITYYSEGYPHFVQQFAYSAFATDTDGIIDREDVVRGAFGKRGAMESIGNRYYRDDFYNRIQTEGYRDILRLMADHLDAWVTKSDLRERFSGSDSTLDNAIAALRDKNIILAKEGERGVYRLHHKGFAWWIKLQDDPSSATQLSDLYAG